MHKGLIIYLSILIGLALSVGGAYFTIDNLIEPQGLLFEGIMSLGLGVAILMIAVFATAVGKAFQLFGEILEQTTELNKQIAKSNKPSLPGLFSGMIPPGSSMTVTDLETGNTQDMPLSGNPGDAIKKMNDMIAMAMAGHKGSKKNTELNDMTDKELEEVLAKAIKDDDFEKASKINAILKSRRSPGEEPEENSPE
jgi:hypothetical protein